MEEAQVPWFDLPERELRKYRTTTAEPDGLDAWWDNQLAHARAKASPSTLRRYRPEAYGPAEVYDVEFSGAHGDVIRAWYIRPPAAGRPTPLAVAFVGYGGGRGVPAEHLALPAAGIATFVMDNRGQGGGWTTGATGDPGRPAEGPEFPGVMTRGISRPETYYYTGWRAGARSSSVAAQTHQGLPARRAVPVRYHPRCWIVADLPVQGDRRLPRSAGRSRAGGHEHVAVRRLRPARPTHRSRVPAERGPDGRDLPAVDRAG
jgi:cephalosporin-C deacetylase